MITNKYIEIRIYLKDDFDIITTVNAAEELKDAISDMVSDESADDIFTEDVTYIIHDGMDDK